MDTELLTYRELADRLGVKLDSARRTARRKGWRREPGNDGTARVHVPIDALPSPKDNPQDTPQDSPTDRPRDDLIPALEAQIEGLKELVSAERARADAAELDRDRWHEQATRSFWKRLAG